MNAQMLQSLRPSPAYVTGSVAVLAFGAIGFTIGLWNAEMTLSEKGYYFITLLFGLFAAISLQRVVRDRAEGLPVSTSYHTLCYVALGIALAALTVGLWNSTMLLSEKGFYGACFIMAMFAAITVQKNVRDIKVMDESFGSSNYSRSRDDGEQQ